jgi:hypothetical protein
MRISGALFFAPAANIIALRYHDGTMCIYVVMVYRVGPQLFSRRSHKHWLCAIEACFNMSVLCVAYHVIVMCLSLAPHRDCMLWNAIH